MARAAKFIVIDDGNLLFPGDFNFQVPSNCYVNEPGILTWMMDIKSLASQVPIKILVNNMQVYNATYGADRYGPIHEVVDPSILKVGKNLLTFQYGPFDDATVIKISDVVIWIEVLV